MLRRTVPTAESAQMPSSDASQHFSVNASQHPTHSGGLQGVGALWGGDRRELSPEPDRKSTRLNSSHTRPSRMPSSA